MKVILSRKGFDSSYGNWPSPILDDNTMVSLPIPHDNGGYRYNEIYWNGNESYADLMNGLHIEIPDGLAHPDPDLNRSCHPHRHSDWRPAFGQDDGLIARPRRSRPQTHLRKNHVGPGDLFLFYGWFADYRERRGHSRPVGKHVIWGYLLVDRLVQITGENGQPYPTGHELEPWSDHPHLRYNPDDGIGNNTLYISSHDMSNLKKRNTSDSDKYKEPHKINAIANLPGAGIFNFNESSVTDYGLVLTREEQSNKSFWKLPKFFYPEQDNEENNPNRKTFTFHGLHPVMMCLVAYNIEIVFHFQPFLVRFLFKIYLF